MQFGGGSIIQNLWVYRIWFDFLGLPKHFLLSALVAGLATPGSNTSVTLKMGY